MNKLLATLLVGAFALSMNTTVFAADATADAAAAATSTQAPAAKATHAKAAKHVHHKHATKAAK